MGVDSIGEKCGGCGLYRGEGMLVVSYRKHDKGG